MGPAPDGSLHVAMVTTSYPRWPGDHAGHFVASLAHSIAEEGHRVTVIAPHDPGAEESESAGGVEVHRVRYLRDSLERTAYGNGIVPNLKRDPRAWVGVPALRRAMTGAVREYAADADVIHAHWAPTVRLAGLGGAEAPVALTLHGTDATLARNSRPWRRVLTDALKQVDGVITVAGEQADQLRDGGLWQGPLEVIPSGVPAELFERERPVRRPGRPFTFAFVGRLIESKGVVDLIEAFTALDRQCAGSCRLVLAGTGPLEGRMRERIVARRLMGEVCFLGHLPHEETMVALGDADALVLPSYGEGSPLSVVEAMALGTPVIGTRVGAVPDILGSEGQLVDPGDVDGLASAMEAWASDPAAAKAAGEVGRKRLAETYSWHELGTRTIAFLRTTIAAASRG